MVERHFAFKGEPFSLTSSDPAIFYRSRQHWLAESFLEYALESQGQFALLTGEVGCGKSLLVSRLMSKLGDDVTVGLINRSYRGLSSIQPLVAQALNAGQHAPGRRTLLIVDEAQNLSADLLEELRLLSNGNSKETVLQILLVGQSELRATLKRPELRQFAQRISAHFHLAALKDHQTHAYIQYRLQMVGGDLALFTTDAMDFVHAHTGGVPRLINQLCHYALVQATTAKRLRIDLDLMKAATQEFRGGFAFQFDSKPVRAHEHANAGMPAAAARPLRGLKVPPRVRQLPAQIARLPARVQRIMRRPAVAAASLVIIAAVAGLVTWRAATKPVAAYHEASRSTAAPPLASVQPAPSAATVAPAAVAAAPATVPTPVSRPLAVPVASPPPSATHAASARGTWFLNRAIDRLNAGDPAGAQRLMAQASAAGARSEDLADLKTGIDSQNLELRLMSTAEQIQADIASDSLLEPAADSAEKRYQEMANQSPSDPLTLRARRDLQRALLSHAQNATRKGQFDVAQRFLVAAGRVGPSAEVTSLQEQLRDEMSRAPAGEGSPRQMTAADPIAAQTPAHRE